ASNSSLEELLCLLVDESCGSVSATREESGDIDTRGKNSMVTALFVRGTDTAAPDSPSLIMRSQKWEIKRRRV
ncbi:MAG: hypothetical protein ACR2L2_00925, partial [Acidobacteriota bacterium]